jgi:DNA processing protein
MEYSRNYSIQRAVIYDAEINMGNPKYDLNRQIIDEGPDTIEINQSNMTFSLQKVLSIVPQFENLQSKQQSMF